MQAFILIYEATAIHLDNRLLALRLSHELLSVFPCGENRIAQIDGSFSSGYHLHQKLPYAIVHLLMMCIMAVEI
ncbi:hypothetical protein PSCICO_17280 [Pseudomonas cichorii]|nr:hypothetical protein PSCICO_17280 [Pseudomonas cichorii]